MIKMEISVYIRETYNTPTRLCHHMTSIVQFRNAITILKLNRRIKKLIFTNISKQIMPLADIDVVPPKGVIKST